jgi:hypothetical protein
MPTNSFLTAETQSSQRRFFLWRREAAREKAYRLFEANSLSRSLPEAERLPFIRPPLTVG